MKRLSLLALAVAATFTLPACAHGPGSTPSPGFAGGIGSLARITVIDRTANRELPVHWKDGRAYVAGQPGNEYQVRVRNVAGEAIGVIAQSRLMENIRSSIHAEIAARHLLEEQAQVAREPQGQAAAGEDVDANAWLQGEVGRAPFARAIEPTLQIPRRVAPASTST